MEIVWVEFVAPRTTNDTEYGGSLVQSGPCRHEKRHEGERFGRRQTWTCQPRSRYPPIWRMAKKRGINPKLQAWVDARKRHRLTHAQVQMARELGMNPKRLGKLDNHAQEPWKLPLPLYIERLYKKSFGWKRPEQVQSAEERARQQELRRRARKLAKDERRAAPAAEENDEVAREGPLGVIEGVRTPPVTAARRSRVLRLILRVSE